MDQYTHLKPMPDSIGDKTASVHINPISLEAEISQISEKHLQKLDQL